MCISVAGVYLQPVNCLFFLLNSSLLLPNSSLLLLNSCVFLLDSSVSLCVALSYIQLLGHTHTHSYNQKCVTFHRLCMVVCAHNVCVPVIQLLYIDHLRLLQLCLEPLDLHLPQWICPLLEESDHVQFGQVLVRVFNFHCLQLLQDIHS